MKKKLLAIVLVLTMVSAFFTGCGTKNNGASNANTTEKYGTTSSEGDTTSKDEGSSTNSYELALVTDVGTIDDKSFNQGSWEGLEKYATENNISYKYYQPTEKTTTSYVETIGLAVTNGAKLVVCPGYLFEAAVFETQNTYPDVKFILLDGQPHSEDYSEFKINDNVYAILYAEEQAGFLAGYAAVKDGYTDLGFMGGMAVPAVIRYGYGYAQGANYAAQELGVANVNLKYNYTGGFNASPEVQSMAASWYTDGTQVIFGCGGGLGNSVMTAAEADASGDKGVIGVDVDQSPESATVISSAMKGLGVSVYDGIKAYYDGSFPGGQVVTLDATNDGVELPMETSKFKTFTTDDYNAIFAKLVASEITLTKNEDADGNAIEITTLDESLANVTIDFVE